MGQKVNAVGLRIGVNRSWNSSWFAGKRDFARYLKEDMLVRSHIEKWLRNLPSDRTRRDGTPDKSRQDSALSRIEISRSKTDKGSLLLVRIHTSRPGVVLGTNGETIKKLQAALRKIVKEDNLRVEVVEVKNPDLDATLVAKWIAGELENRQSFRSTQKKAIQRMRKAGAAGCRTQCQGRLGGAEIARREGYKEGVVPLETLRADIDFAAIPAHTTSGRIGVKVWICRSTDGRKAQEERPQEGGSTNASAKAR